MKKITVYKKSLKEAQKLGIDSWNRWECQPSSFDWEYPEEEIAYFFDGEVLVTTAEDSYLIKANMLAVFPKGLKCHWEVRKRIIKVYTFNFGDELNL